MKINDRLHGFKVLREVRVPDVSGTLYELTHEGSGASLYYLARPDENKTFAIAFRTLPVDDTGVFHIIEHSVLCGSDRYPVKEPFVELLKGSQNTFLNALTYEDRTVYPVSSRNPKDFLNLVSVYMDAVLHPRALTNPQIFRQEGWHYELDAEGNLIYNGVVFNEMKGAYSSPDEISMATAKATLFPDTPYRYESGGAPSAIPDLTYEQFCASHRKFYHPTNAMMFLDGEVDLDRTLALLNEFLAEYTPIERTEAIKPQPPIDGGVTTVHYELSETEDPEGKARLSLNFVFGTPADGALMLGTSIILDTLLGSNDAPLKKAVLASGRAEDLDVFTNRTVQQSIQIEARGVKEENLSALEELITSTIREIAERGIDKNALSSALNAIEFKLREMDYGSFPRGVAFALSVFGATNYERAPESALYYEADIKALRDALATDYYEKTLLAMTVENPHHSKVIMLPDKEYGKRVSAEEKERLAAHKAS
ncbi:MAG: insulinase family protein, partial [Clostridia bacterium]|nr:insulinase family protein [Clostridia bacterium]